MNIREISFDLLEKIYKNKSFSNIELNATIRNNSLSELDKAFLTRLVYGTIKDSRMLDYEISKATDNKNIKPPVRTLLKMSLYQLRSMDKVPAYAVINEAVEISKDRFGNMTSKFVNAVLRRLTRDTFTPKIEEFENEMEYYTLIYSFPTWVGHMISKQYSKDIAIEYMKAYKQPAPITFRVNTLKAKKSELLDTNLFLESKLSDTGLIYIGDKSINNLQEFLDGKIIPQGESSQLVTKLLDPKENDIVLDMCAAPGGKTYHCAALMNNTGKIYSVDLYEHRVKLIVPNLKRLGITNVEAITYDATKLTNKFEAETFDKILLDAPCSGLGVVRRKPDILFNLKQDDIDGILDIQQKLIDTAVKLLKVNGEMVYSTCTINRKENEQQIKYLLDKYENMELIDQQLILPNKETIDGFFMAKLRKKN